MRGGYSDVIVVGAGFTGLTAALDLIEAGLDVLVLEARSRVGGRVESKINGLGEHIDTGGQFLCDDMPELMALVRRFGKTLVNAHATSDYFTPPPMAPLEAAQTYAGSATLYERVRAIAPHDPEIVGVTVAIWLDRQPDDPNAKNAFRSTVEELLCQSIVNIPLWYLIDSDRRVNSMGAEFQYFLRETMHSLAHDLAAGFGNRLRLASPVKRIVYEPSRIQVDTDDCRFSARSAIVAVPPGMASRITYAPPFPDQLATALRAWRSGSVIKALVRYKRSFWRDAGRGRTVMWRDIHGLFACEASKDDEHPALVVFVGGPLALRWHQLRHTDLRVEITKQLVAVLGPQAGVQLEFSLRDWTSDQWSGGGYSDSIMEISAHNAESVIRAGCPPLHFASSELSSSFPSYIEGAIVAGREVARKVTADLACQFASNALPHFASNIRHGKLVPVDSHRSATLQLMKTSSIETVSPSSPP